jgi:hypothetical protein
MAKSPSKQSANDPAHHGPGEPRAPEGSAGNANLGSMKPVSRAAARGRRKPVPAALRPQLDALFRDTTAAAEALRRWVDGPGRLWREGLAPEAGARVALEHLCIHTGLMQVMNWLLHPAHHGDAVTVGPFDQPPPGPLPPDHPIRAVEGLSLSEAVRALHARAAAIARQFARQEQP